MLSDDNCRACGVLATLNQIPSNLFIKQFLNNDL